MSTHLLRHGTFIAMPEGFTVLVLQLARNSRMAVFIAIVHVRTAVIVQVLARPFHAILKAAALDFAAHPGTHFLATAIRLAHLFRPDLLHWRSAHEVRHTLLIAPAKAFTVRFPLFARNMRLAILIAVVHVGRTVVIAVFAGALDTIMKALTLELTELRRWRIPSARALLIAGRRWPGLLRKSVR